MAALKPLTMTLRSLVMVVARPWTPRNGGEAHGERDERVLDEVLPFVFVPEADEQAAERIVWCGGLDSQG